MTSCLCYSIDPGIKSTVYCTAIAEGTTNEWEFALRWYKTENLAEEKARLLYALACSKETWVLSKYVLNLILKTRFEYFRTYMKLYAYIFFVHGAYTCSHESENSGT